MVMRIVIDSREPAFDNKGERMSDEEKQLARFLIILLEAGREAIQTVTSNEFDELDGELATMIQTLKDEANVC